MKRVLIVACMLLSSPVSGGSVSHMNPNGILGLSWVGNFSSKQYAGLSCYRVIPGEIGWFAEYKFDARFSTEDSDFYEDISVSQAEGWDDRLLETDQAYNTLNVGLTYPISNQIYLYGGVGISFFDNYRNYYDDFHILGSNGSYWIESSGGGSDFNSVFGTIFRPSNSLALHMAYDTNPRGINFGLGIVTDWIF